MKTWIQRVLPFEAPQVGDWFIDAHNRVGRVVQILSLHGQIRQLAFVVEYAAGQTHFYAVPEFEIRIRDPRRDHATMEAAVALGGPFVKPANDPNYGRGECGDVLGELRFVDPSPEMEESP